LFEFDGFRASNLSHALSIDFPAASAMSDLHEVISFDDIEVLLTPFYDTVTIDVRLDLAHEFPLGFSVSTCSVLHQAFISELHRSPLPRISLRLFHQKYLGAYLVSLHGAPIFYPRDVDSVLTSLRALAHSPTEVTLVFRTT
jgi:hypothetical protein